ESGLLFLLVECNLESGFFTTGHLGARGLCLSERVALATASAYVAGYFATSRRRFGCFCAHLYVVFWRAQDQFCTLARDTSCCTKHRYVATKCSCTLRVDGHSDGLVITKKYIRHCPGNGYCVAFHCCFGIGCDGLCSDAYCSGSFTWT